MASKSSTPITTRGRKASIKDGITIEDISSLILKSEDRMKAFFKNEIMMLTERLSGVEKCLSYVQTECAHLDDEVSKLKTVIVNQQLQIEAHEQKMRANNLIFHYVPEEDLSLGSGSEELSSDREKVDMILESSNTDLSGDDIVSLQRLGKRQPGKSRPLKIVFEDSEKKYQLLNMRRSISTNDRIQRIFHRRIYINCDSSFLMQKEEFRLRQKLKQLKSENPGSSSYIRSGTLYLNGTIFDKIDVKNQLF